MDVDSELDRLYSADLSDFIKERDAIAFAAKDAGDAGRARSVKKLLKPSVAAWAINQLARVRSEIVDELLSVRDALEKAESPAELRELSGRRRQLVARLTAAAKDLLAESGHGTSQSTLEKISQGLLATGSEEEREQLRRGRLTREPTASGLEAFGVVAPDGPEGEAAPKVPLKTQREVQRLRREAERLQQEAARLAQEAAFAEEQARRTRAKANEAADAADAAQAKAEEAAADAGL